MLAAAAAVRPLDVWTLHADLVLPSSRSSTAPAGQSAPRSPRRPACPSQQPSPRWLRLAAEEDVRAQGRRATTSSELRSRWSTAPPKKLWRTRRLRDWLRTTAFSARPAASGLEPRKPTRSTRACAQRSLPQSARRLTRPRRGWRGRMPKAPTGPKRGLRSLRRTRGHRRHGERVREQGGQQEEEATCQSGRLRCGVFTCDWCTMSSAYEV